jgi:hypothetical protein
MKLTLPFILLFGLTSVSAQEVQTGQEAASAPEVAASAALVDGAPAASAPEASASAPVVIVREGYIWKMQHCRGGNGGSGSRWGSILKNTVLQLSSKAGLGLVGQTVGAEAVGNVIGSQAEAPAEERKMCVTVAFKDGTEDQDTVIPLIEFENKKLRIRGPAIVRFEDGKPVYFGFY